MNIFIAGLSYNISDSDLTELFAEYGEVASARVISDRETGRSKGYGFVEMADEEAGNKAISALNEAEIDGRKLAVSVARPKEESGLRVAAITAVAIVAVVTVAVIVAVATVAVVTDINLTKSGNAMYA